MKYKQLFYPQIDDISIIYNGSQLISFYMKNEHLAYNILITYSLASLWESEFGTEVMLETEKDVFDFCKSKNILLLIVNLGVSIITPSNSEFLNVYAKQSNIYKEFEAYIPTTYPINVLKMTDLNCKNKCKLFYSKL